MGGLVALAGVLLFAADTAALSRDGDVSAAGLPAEARATLALIKSGGPLRYDKDGAVFGNREGRLPRHARGYYREYTVRTPGVRDRGSRRIIAGSAGEFYYTDDHYRTFMRIQE